MNMEDFTRNRKQSVCIPAMCLRTENPDRCPFIKAPPLSMIQVTQWGDLFDLEDSGYFYTRLQNPSNDMIAAKIADLEGGIAAMLTSSGQAANFALFNICETGSHIVASSANLRWYIICSALQ